MSTTRYRIILLLLGLALIVVVVGAVLFSPQGSPSSYPAAVEAISPEDGDLVFANTRVVLDLEGGYRAHFVIDDIEIPDDEVRWTEQTGLHIFEPGPGKTIETWTPGFHVVAVTWDRTTGLPDPGNIRWSFRVQ
jgi:hypothetical protein